MGGKREELQHEGRAALHVYNFGQFNYTLSREKKEGGTI